MWWSNGFYYLACPYSHEIPAVRDLRVEQSRLAQAALLEIGIMTYNPISHTHELVKYLRGNPSGYDFWHKMDEQFLKSCEGILVMQLDGWERSKGILGELAFLSNTRGFFSARWVYPNGTISGEWTEKMIDEYMAHISSNVTDPLLA